MHKLKTAIIAGTCASAVSLAFAPAHANPLSAFEITVDGQFTGWTPGSGALTTGEWSDIVPLAFISPPTNAGALAATTLTDPNANSFLYGGLAPGASQPVDALYLLYDYLARTNSSFESGEVVADITFPITVQSGGIAPTAGGIGLTDRVVPIVVQVRGTGYGAQVSTSVVGDFDGTGTPGQTKDPDDLGFELVLGFNRSPEGDQRTVGNHMIIELEVPLLVDLNKHPDFIGGPVGQQPGVNGTGYSPDPAFWGGSFANDLVDPGATAAMFTIHPDGSTTIVEAVPEPSTLALLGLGLLAGVARRRKRY